MQYIYNKYGRERAGLAATVITYRTRSAIREVGKVFGLSEDTIGALSGTIWGWSSEGVREADVRRVGLDPAEATHAPGGAPVAELIGFPRHLSQHVGGFVMTRDRLDEMVPIMNAAMEDRTIVEWDKDDLDALGMLKVDVLALGMLSCIRRAFDFMGKHYGWSADAGHDPEGGPGRLRHALPRRLPRRLPGREPGADVDAAAAEAERVLRSRHRGGDRPPRPDPGRHGPSLSPAAAGHREGASIPRPSPEHGPADELRRCSGAPSACRSSRSRRCRSPSSRRNSPAARPTGSAAPWRPSGAPARSGISRTRWSRAWSRAATSEIRRALLPADRGFRRIRLPGEPRGELRAPRLRLVLAQVPLPRRLLRRPPQLPADGLLRARPDRPRRDAPRRRGPPRRRQFLRLGLDAGGRPSPLVRVRGS